MEPNAGTPPKLALDPPVSEKQRRAMYAAAAGHSTLGIPKSVGEEFVGKAHDQAQGAGVMFFTPKGDALFMRRNGNGDHGGEWAFPGGMVEDDEEPDQAAAREAFEETGGLPHGERNLVHRSAEHGDVDFHTYAQQVHDRFEPKLNDEHDAYVWAPLHKPPSPLHPGIGAMLSKFSKSGAAENEGREGKDASVAEMLAEMLMRKMLDEPHGHDAGWEESKHPRATTGEHAGEFTSGGGGKGGGGGKEPPTKPAAAAPSGGGKAQPQIGTKEWEKKADKYYKDLAKEDPSIRNAYHQGKRAAPGTKNPGFGSKEYNEAWERGAFVAAAMKKGGHPGGQDAIEGQHANASTPLKPPSPDPKKVEQHKANVEAPTVTREQAHDTVTIALDRDSVRSYDHDGRLHVAVTNISKANICPYMGREIPNWEQLGLQPDKVYRLLRDPEELRKAADTFNGLPLLITHKPHNSKAHDPDLVIGATGNEAEFKHPYLMNSLVVWPEHAIDAIESHRQKEISSGYRYRADMTPGNYEGSDYDGVMRDLVGNHVAIVKEGRAGSDVVVGDSKENFMAKAKLLSRKAALVSGALIASLGPRLAEDTSLDLTSILKDLTAENYQEHKASILDAIKPVLAEDASMADIHKLLDSLDDENPAEEGEEKEENGEDAEVDPNAPPPTEKPESPPTNFDWARDWLMSKGMSEDDVAEFSEMVKKANEEKAAKDEPPPFEGKPKSPTGDQPAEAKPDEEKKAMDDAIKLATDNAIRVQREIREAERKVRPWVGELSIACDSAEHVFRTALTMLGVKNIEKVHADALPFILESQPLPGAKKPQAVPAMDENAVADFAKRFPGAARIRVIG